MLFYSNLLITVFLLKHFCYNYFFLTPTEECHMDQDQMFISDPGWFISGGNDGYVKLELEVI